MAKNPIWKGTGTAIEIIGGGEGEAVGEDTTGEGEPDTIEGAEEATTTKGGKILRGGGVLILDTTPLQGGEEGVTTEGEEMVTEEVAIITMATVPTTLRMVIIQRGELRSRRCSNM